MCHADDSRPPAPPADDPRRSAVAATADLVLVDGDGTAFAASAALPERPRGAGVVVYPDVRGLHPFYVHLTHRFAEAGVPAIAFDYFGRTDGVAQRDDDFPYADRIGALTPDEVAGYAAAASGWLRAQDGVRAVFTVGFCFGGSMSWRSSADGLDVAGSIGFYGIPSRVEDAVGAIDAPLLLLLAGQDRATTPEQNAAFLQLLAEAGGEHEAHVYEGAPHSFFDRASAEHADDCEDAWRRVLDFVDARTSTS